MTSHTVVVKDMWSDAELGRFTAESQKAAWDAAWAEFGWNDGECCDVKFFEEMETLNESP